LIDLLDFAVKEAQRQGASESEAYGIVERESDVFIESNDLKQAKSQNIGAIGIRVVFAGSSGFSSVNSFRKNRIKEAVTRAVRVARASPQDRYSHFPDKEKIRLLNGIYDRKAESFIPQDAARMAKELLEEAISFDKRITVDSGGFTSSLATRSILNSNGQSAEEKISAFSWSLMGMAIEGTEVSSFDSQFGACHHVKDIDISKTARDFAETVLGSLHPAKIQSFVGEMILTPAATSELVQDVVVHSINSDAVQKGSSRFAGRLGKKVSSEILEIEDDPTDTRGMGSSSFDREGVPHRRNIVIKKGVLKKFLYNARTAAKAGVPSTGNAGGPATSPPVVSTTNFIIKPGRLSLDRLVSEVKKGIMISRFSGNVDPITGDFSGVVKGGKFVKNGSIEHAVKDVMVAGNVFKLLQRITGLSKEHRIIYDSILPYIRFEKASFTGG
jgi:PmbA protein